MEFKRGSLIAVVFVGLLVSSSSSYGVERDVNCLKSLKNSFQDPLNYLSSWNFTNHTPGFICTFAGVECWHPDENKVLNIRLSDMGLKGKFPRALANCSSLVGLDLSGNLIYGTIPSEISEIIPFITSLELSSNNFSGSIPRGLANCSYLNILKLDRNRLTGSIPRELGLLSRIRTFNVANNCLSGPVPHFINNASIPAESYANNSGLCGGPLSPCHALTKKTHPTGVVTGLMG
ncbi:Non-specific serine/threonine protein kinase [Bertholletia excelsa]